jgi:hypothetical protein
MILTETDLLKLTGLRQRAALRRHLRKAGIPFRVVAGAILTTEDAVTASLVGSAHAKKNRPNLDAVR